MFVNTSYPNAELFINGKSQGIREKNDSTLQTRYRLMWNETRYEPGELRVVAFDENGRKAEEKTVKTAGKPHHIVLTSNRDALHADGDDLVYITVKLADKDGNIVPVDSRRVKYAVRGSGSFEATANGDPTSLLSFRSPEMDLFGGAATVIVRSEAEKGNVTLTVSAKGVKSATFTLPVQ